ncbi:hypothetical protein [Micromonospora sp. NBC_01638]|uniref:hypothetical protein n=1 Tax=Micromonospora sp. NBC_01638 TaxID=2975982 RepID=UPI003864D50C|nr:hypothetical protein OG811_01690 [Micromonospora sp. NBC_01638]
MRRIITTLTLLALSLVAFLTPTPASAASTVEITSATLVARGVAVDLTITVTCPAGATGDAELILRQRVGNRVAYASGWAPISCSGEPQAATGRMFVEAGGLVFHKGVAIANGHVELCDQGECEYPQFNDTIRITG